MKTTTEEDALLLPPAFQENWQGLPEPLFMLRKKLYIKAKREPKFRNESQGGQSQAADLIHSRSGCCSLNEAFIAFTST